MERGALGGHKHLTEPHRGPAASNVEGAKDLKRFIEGGSCASRALLGAAAEQSPLAVRVFAPDGTSLLVNSAWEPPGGCGPLSTL